ncbi:hypothetical protein DEU56DRAFT_763901 [Suillus clintonianus]|uniref:uncharacterized protein n=1 Tax=Suillus clintonianus TaxID=1904413 RepID=UPI001B87D18C|nr:uncharacterized protein DEU56DRAFT_763901 [Suillus clintonianus]KAG2157290.1 hypothetical protein DEU56DRAFT_763901 [Suillus clintonianus]
MVGFRPTNTSSPAKPLTATQRPLVSFQATISDVSRVSAASKSELQNLTPAEVEFFDAVVKRIPPSATSFLSGLKAYNDELHDRGWDSQTETVHYGRLLELCKLRGPSWNHKWEVVKEQYGYGGMPSTIPVPTMSARAPIPTSKPARSTARLATPVRDEDDDVFTLHSHQDQEQDGTTTETPSSDAESEQTPPRPLMRLNQATRPNASAQLTRVTRTPTSRPSNTILPPALTRVSTPRPQTDAAHHQPAVWEGTSDTTDDGDLPGSLSTTPPSYRAAVATPVPLNARGQPMLRASSPIKYPAAVNATEFPKGRERKGSVINEDEAWKKIKMSRDEEDADKFRQDKLLERCWEIWVLGYQWLTTTKEQVAEARDNVILGSSLRSWRNATASRLEMHARAASIADARRLRFALDVWAAKHKQKRQLQWRSDMRAKMKTVRERHETQLIKYAWVKWQQSHRSFQNELQYNERIVARYFMRWKNSLLKLDRLDSAADDFSRKIKGSAAHRAWKHWQKSMATRDAEKTVAHKVALRTKGMVVDLWKKQTRERQTADAYRDVAMLKRAMRTWQTARDRIRVKEKRADKYLARQDAFLLRAVARVWKARERGKLLERVRDMRLVKNAIAVWKDRIRSRKHLEDYALAFSMRSDSYGVSSAMRTWHQVYTIYQNRRACAVQHHLARVQYDALLKWRIQLREKMKLLKQARFVEKFILQRRILKVWKAKFEERQRLKKLKELETRRLRALMTAWHHKYQKKKFRRLAVQQIDELVSLRIKRDALRLWTNRVIEIKLRELEVRQKNAHALTVFAFKKWKNICLRHVEDLSLMESHLDIKRAENVRRMFHRWLTAARARRHKRITLREKELEFDRANVQVAWNRWRERYMNEKLQPLLRQMAIQNQKNCLFRTFGIWHSKTRSLPAIRFQASQTKMRYWAIWRAAMPQALQAKRAREIHNHAVLNRAFEKWHEAYKTKTHLKEIARARYLRLPSVSPGRIKPTLKPPVRTSHSPFTRQVTYVDSETEGSDAGPSRPAATQSSVLVTRPGIARLLATQTRPEPVARQSSKAPSRGLRDPSPTRSNKTSIPPSQAPSSPVRPRFTARRAISPARSRSSYAREVSPTRSNYTSTPREEPERSRLWQELRQVQKRPRPPTEKSRTPEPP